MEKLKRVLAQEDTILFVGSGISMWSGLPSWSGLIAELADFTEREAGGNADIIRAEAARGDLLQAASYGFDKLTRPQVGEFIRRACRYGRATPHEIHRSIVSLGPRFFITTNYDDLIEQSLRAWQPGRFYPPPVTNRHLTETASVVHARALNFVFKPHGDASDIESIILTREQYRLLLPNGERQAALESLKMLLATRPVVYLGFGLRDPDFGYVRDILANIYKGGIRDHYAIMADVGEDEIAYWRRAYGIHLIPYSTVERPDGSRDHYALLTLLASLKQPDEPAPKSRHVDSSEVVLALARYAAGLARARKVDAELPIWVDRLVQIAGSSTTQEDWREHQPVDEFLDRLPDCAALIGLPGTGKSYSLRRAAARMAETLHQACMSEPFNAADVTVPLLADLKLYSGSVRELLAETLPQSLPLDWVLQNFPVKIFLDSFNEMPREHLDAGTHEADLVQFLDNNGSASIVIASRTEDGLTNLDLPVYILNEIEKSAVLAELGKAGIQASGRFSNELLQLLQRPFYFHHFASGAVQLPKDPHPRDFYRSFLANITDAFAQRFGDGNYLETILSLCAYGALNRGEEAFALADLTAILEPPTPLAGSRTFDAQEVANWLVSISILTPYRGGRVAFVHQSVTEYLAAMELARRYQAAPEILTEKLALTRWDQAIFLTLSLLPPEHADRFLWDVAKADFALALRAAKYIEFERDRVVAALLSWIPSWYRAICASEFGTDPGIAEIVRTEVPVSSAHIPQLENLLDMGGRFGAAASERILQLRGGEVKDRLLKWWYDNRGKRFNFGEANISRALSAYITVDDAKQIVEWADSVEGSAAAYDFSKDAARLLGNLELAVVREILLPPGSGQQRPSIRTQIAHHILTSFESPRNSPEAALEFAGELLLRGEEHAAWAIDFNSVGLGDERERLAWKSFGTLHVERLLAILLRGGQFVGDTAASRALMSICAARPDLAEPVRQAASTRVGIERGVLLTCANPEDTEPLFEALERYATLGADQRASEQIGLLSQLTIDWADREYLFLRLMELRDERLARQLFGSSTPPNLLNLGYLRIDSIDGWLDWMNEMKDPAGTWSRLAEQLAGVLAIHANTEAHRQRILSELNQPTSKYRDLLVGVGALRFRDVTTDAFTEETISYLLADLNREDRQFRYGNILDYTATERFVAERLLPLLPNAAGSLRRNLMMTLDTVGERHGRRYLFELIVSKEGGGD